MEERTTERASTGRYSHAVGETGTVPSLNNHLDGASHGDENGTSHRNGTGIAALASFPRDVRAGWHALWAYPGIRKAGLAIVTLFLLVLWPIAEADFPYIDDNHRNATGTNDFGWGRHYDFFMSWIVHADRYLPDIAPWTQLLATLIMAAAALILVVTFARLRRQPLTVWHAIAVVPLIASPYFLECLSYRYDSPYMASSVFFAVLPLLFSGFSAWVIVPVATLSTIVVCSSYQASLGLLPVTALVWVAVRWIDGTTWANLWRPLVSWAGGYALGMAIYQVLLTPGNSGGYATTTPLPLGDMLPGIVRNLREYYGLINSDFTRKWLLVVALIVLAFVIAIVVRSNRNRIVAAVVALVMVGVGATLCFGVYIALARPLFATRAMYGFFDVLVVFGLVALTSVPMRRGTRGTAPASQNAKLGIFHLPQTVAKIGATALTWMMLVFTYMYANAAQDQMRYNEFRVSMMYAQLQTVPNFVDNPQVELAFEDQVGYAPRVAKMPQTQHVLGRLVGVLIKGGSDWVWPPYTLYTDYGTPPDKIIHNYTLKSDTLQLVSEGYYQDIYAEGNKIVVKFKTRS